MKTVPVLSVLILLSLLVTGIANNAMSNQTPDIALLSLENTNWTDEEIAYIRALHRKGSIKVATKISYAVYFPQEDGSIGGFHYRVLKEFADLAQVDIDIQLVEWNDYFYKKDGDLERLQSDNSYSYIPSLIENVDLYLDGITVLPWREKMFDIITFIPSRQMLVVRKDSYARQLTDLDGKVCAMVRDTSMAQNLQQVSASNKIKFGFIDANNFEDMEQLVATGKADFTVLDSDRAFAALKRYDNLKIAWPISDIQMLGWATDKRNKVLKSIIGKYLKHALETAILDEFWEKYYGVRFIEYLRIMNLGGDSY